MPEAKRRKRVGTAASRKVVSTLPGRVRLLAAARADAEGAGLLSGQRTEHLSVRTTRALLKAAKRRTGVSSNTELIELALAALAAPDPVTAFMMENYGVLGEKHTLEY